ncbi:hypothetical protein UFOVP979_15 [uncultured Caudovirales phage]|uniref:Uncharacterized protein n=1 Tax=uncultured Caudovirales phage TaxID=2100421 RepID=A0A6J5PVN5_9CAUD|nr:hypothetical protein UFOVP979_15 [uncultured Caudovirales phage]CAB4217349.1 hypothetical protein UFOVP1503_21 [uncultured Caudovirales phage]CAB5225734.1 hypothetical protein UFOVP1505_5 [uncultured Caudovirales phage]
MTNYAQIINNIVVNVIVADKKFIAMETDETLIEYTDENPAGIGYGYNPITKMFIPPAPIPIPYD